MVISPVTNYATYMSLLSLLTFVDKQHENDDIYTFRFSVKHKLDHKAGQHGIFMLPGLYRPHPFTLSSSPDEKYVTFSTHTATGSKFKQRILNLKPGAKMFLLGPILNFTFIEGASKYVFLAQGIGVTPFRSMLAYAHANQLPITTTLIHVDGKGHTFEKLTQQYATLANYPTNPDEFKKIVQDQDVDQPFYLSGSPRFVSATKLLLNECGVQPKNIRTDSFFGY